MLFAKVNGQQLLYTDTASQNGTSDAPVIIFSHGLLMNHTMFAAQIAVLRQKYRCIAWDERGHGLTNHGAEPTTFSYYDSAADLAALLEHLNVRQAILAGMSQGGYLSLRAALKYPELVRALILLDTQAAREDAESGERNVQFAHMWAENGISDFLLDTAEQVIIGEGYPDIAAWREYWRAFPARNFAQCVNTLNGRDDITKALHKIKVPALVVHGDEDAAIPLERAEILAKELHAELVVIKGAGHAANMTHPSEVNTAILKFLATLPPEIIPPK